jgi:hypothetical protein
MQRREFVTLLCAAAAWPFAARAAAVTLTVMTALGSTASVQQVPPSWNGTFEWTHICKSPSGFGIKTRGVGNLELSYSESGEVEDNGTRHPERTLNGRLDGNTPENMPSAPGCSVTMLAPGTFSAFVTGSYTPVQNTFSASVYRVNSTPDARVQWQRKRV